jgi:hypothetical protein
MFSQKEKRAHYNAVAKGEKPVKAPSKFPPQSQKDYARGQADARNEAAAIYMGRNSTPEQTAAYRERKAAALTGKCGVCGKPCGSKYKQCYACYKSGNTAPIADGTAQKTAAATPAKAATPAPLKNSAAPKDGFYAKYQQVKAKNKDALLFFRLGDFYEVMGSDAETVSKVLDLTLTTRAVGSNDHIPMCGVPHHALDRYLAKLTQSGYKVAVAES